MIPNGYKETEIGVIPLDWEVDKLENLTTKIGDGLHGTPKYVEQSNYYFINGNNLNGRCIKIIENTKCVTEKEYIKNKKILDNTTLLLSINGTIGSLAYYNNEMVMLGKSVAYMNVNQKILKDFLFYLLKSNTIINYFRFELTGTTIKNLSLKTIRNTKIPLPPLTQQQKIAKILSTTDNKIEAITKQIEKAEMVKKGLMQRLFDKGEEEILDNICSKIIGGGTPNTKIDAYWKNGTIPWATVKDMDNRKYLDSTQDFITQEGLDNSSANLIPANSIITATRMGVGRFFINSIDMAINQDLKALIIKEKYDKNFIFWSLVSKSKLLESMGTGTTVKGIRLEEFKKIQFNIPPLKQQQKIANILTKSDQKIEILKAKREQYQALKKGLMQKLLMGEVGV